MDVLEFLRDDDDDDDDYDDDDPRPTTVLRYHYLPLLVLLALSWPVLLTLVAASVSASAWLFWLCVGSAFGVLQLAYVLHNFAMIVRDVSALTLLKTFAMLRSVARRSYFGLVWVGFRKRVVDHNARMPPGSPVRRVRSSRDFDDIIISRSAGDGGAARRRRGGTSQRHPGVRDDEDDNSYVGGYVTLRRGDDRVAVVVRGRTDVNRAVDGDVVAVELLPVERWPSASDRNDDNGGVGDRTGRTTTEGGGGGGAMTSVVQASIAADTAELTVHDIENIADGVPLDEERQGSA
ncbi:hypothetical protein ACHAXA_008358 [Cyclostephanos tholiformis]|uniref:Uncharacterized protein n=1 Tax=Cyclostephanos tholiformis TaxID=382380 RepID=A0ABD3RW13_9STRA